jgi:hypothetical protein
MFLAVRERMSSTRCSSTGMSSSQRCALVFYRRRNTRVDSMTLNIDNLSLLLVIGFYSGFFVTTSRSRLPARVSLAPSMPACSRCWNG